MAHLYKLNGLETAYSRKTWRGTQLEYQHALDTSTTVYVGDLSFFTREEQIWELFSRVGEVKRIVMGLNKFELTPCGFCFVEYVFPHFWFSIGLPRFPQGRKRQLQGGVAF